MHSPAPLHSAATLVGDPLRKLPPQEVMYLGYLWAFPLPGGYTYDWIEYKILLKIISSHFSY